MDNVTRRTPKSNVSYIYQPDVLAPFRCDVMRQITAGNVFFYFILEKKKKTVHTLKRPLVS